MGLQKYHQKRDFKKTTEPKGKVAPLYKKKSGLYVIQKHAASHLHYDFRLELNGVLISWAVPKGPSLDPAVKRLAVHVEDHPLEYGTFEGIIPKGQYGGGTVMLWDKGKWIAENENSAASYHQGNLTFRLEGNKLKGRWKLFRINKDDKTWLLCKIKDEYSKSSKQYDITLVESKSVVSKKNIDEIAENCKNIWSKTGLKKVTKVKSIKKNAKLFNVKKLKIKLPSISPFPTKIRPQLATLVDEPPEGLDWLHEIKFDGYRLLAFKEKNKTKLYTRNTNDWTEKFKAIAAAVNNLSTNKVILDGEIVILDENQHSNFQLLQNSIKDNQGDFIYYIFDLIYIDNCNISSLSIIKRKEILKQLLTSSDPNILRYSDHVIGSGKEMLEKCCKLGLEGIVSKNVTSSYIQKRSSYWLKSKCIKRQEFIIGGFTKPQGKREFFGSLLLGTYNKKQELIYHGNVGTGFTEASLINIFEILKKNICKQAVFKDKPAGNNITWVKPTLIIEVEFTEWTKEGSLRHPSFKGIRTDKMPKGITKESETSIRKIVLKGKNPEKIIKDKPYKLTHPDKILYPEDKITKKQVVEYYANIHKWILPYITNRPLTLVRCPEGINKCFYQKHITESTPSSLYGVMVKEKDKKAECIYIKDKEGLIALPQLGTLEIHPWNSQVKNIEHPDIIIFDLDPAPNVPWKKVVAAAFEVKHHLAEFKLRSFVKTTGGKGLHIVIPILPQYDWDEIKSFAHTFVDFLVVKNPKSYVSQMTKSKRVGKIYIDYLRNQRGATAVAPYSTRARKNAPVATPIHWEELTSNIHDTFFNIKTLPIRMAELKNDPWKDFFKIKQALKLNKLK